MAANRAKEEEPHCDTLHMNPIENSLILYLIREKNALLYEKQPTCCRLRIDRLKSTLHANPNETYLYIVKYFSRHLCDNSTIGLGKDEIFCFFLNIWLWTRVSTMCRGCNFSLFFHFKLFFFSSFLHAQLTKPHSNRACMLMTFEKHNVFGTWITCEHIVCSSLIFAVINDNFRQAVACTPLLPYRADALLLALISIFFFLFFWWTNFQFL